MSFTVGLCIVMDPIDHVEAVKQRNFVIVEKVNQVGGH